MSRAEKPGRVAVISVHTSPLERPGTGDAGGLNVYVVETARRLAHRGIQVEVFTRATDGAQADTVPLPGSPDVLVHHVPAGPLEGLGKDDLPAQLCAFSSGVLHAAAARPEGWFDVVHTHYWLSGQAGQLAADRWNAPLVHTMHTMARVKNRGLAAGEEAEPPGREEGEAQVVRAASVLVANTEEEAEQLVALYGADPASVQVVAPGVDLETFTPGDRDDARAGLGLEPRALVLLFVGRVQPLKGPDVLVRAVAAMVRRDPDLRGRLVLAVLGGPSGSGLNRPELLREVAEQEGVADLVRLVPPVSREELAQWYRAADLVAMPSHSESFGLVALEALASGTPVVAARVGGLPTAVGDAGVLVDGHDPQRWATVLLDLLADERRRAELSAAGPVHARRYSWERTADQLAGIYRQAIADRPASVAP